MSVAGAGTAAGGGGDVGRWSRHCGRRRWRCRSLEPALRLAEVAMSVAGAAIAATGGLYRGRRFRSWWCAILAGRGGCFLYEDV